jgi:hypothetical protein
MTQKSGLKSSISWLCNMKGNYYVIMHSMKLRKPMQTVTVSCSTFSVLFTAYAYIQHMPICAFFEMCDGMCEIFSLLHGHKQIMVIITSLNSMKTIWNWTHSFQLTVTRAYDMIINCKLEMIYSSPLNLQCN